MRRCWCRWCGGWIGGAASRGRIERAERGIDEDQPLDERGILARRQLDRRAGAETMPDDDRRAAGGAEQLREAVGLRCPVIAALRIAFGRLLDLGARKKAVVFTARSTGRSWVSKKRARMSAL